MAKAATTRTTDLPDNPTFEQAARAAIAEHSEPEQAEGDEEGDESTQGEGDEGDESDDDDESGEAEGDESEGDEDAEGDEDEAEGEDDEEPGRRTAPRAETGKPGELISDKEWQALQAKHKNDPEAMRKALDKVFTQKLQGISRERRLQERVEKYGDLIEQYEQNPEAVVRALAEDLGLVDLKPGEAAPTSGDVKQTAEELTAALLDEFRTELGSDYDYLADPVGKAVLKLVTGVVKDMVSEQTKSLREGINATITERGKEKTEAVMSEFAETHPDWQEHEEEMFQLSQRLAPQKGMSEIEYLENLYTIVTTPKTKEERDKEVGRQVKKAVEKMRRKATTSTREEDDTPERVVRQGPPSGRLPTFTESYEAAKRGERWD